MFCLFSLWLFGTGAVFAKSKYFSIAGSSFPLIKSLFLYDSCLFFYAKSVIYLLEPAIERKMTER